MAAASTRREGFSEMFARETDRRDVSLTKVMHGIWQKQWNVCPGILVDATVGKGRDTLELARISGTTEFPIHGFDVQPQAIEQATELLNREGFVDVKLHCLSHHYLGQRLSEEGVERGTVANVCFNLGFLPSSDKTITTQKETTLQALEQASLFLREEGLLSVLSYVGHPGGVEEYEAVLESCLELRGRGGWTVHHFDPHREGRAPELCPKIIILRKDEEES
ncbi:rRNA methylase [Chloropicon primus]|uniref:rRNA methylase n=1 Tax=Chloropicon primus TaxID=1764295 RepID=A0A5B8MPP3_9CHLO|nr:rRNA methylase [Chloropicon primus]UPR01614.1 rRNA methylase [Chloropicon primus]|eukprot:QDZ22397.1 rRNA methylase [Chloropicon primus]